MKNAFEKAVNLTLAVSAVAVASIAFIRETRSSGPQITKFESGYFKEWKKLLPAARILGSDTAPIMVVEITDFQCPYCKRFNDVLHVVQQRLPSKVAVAVVHFPLPSHSKARSAAQAVECAARFGRTQEMIDQLFMRQDSLGLKPWSRYALDAGISDSASFGRCLGDSTSLKLVDRGLAIGSEINVMGTPTVFLNGWRYGIPPSDSEMIRAVNDILEGRIPYATFPRSGLRITR